MGPTGVEMRAAPLTDAAAVPAAGVAVCTVNYGVATMIMEALPALAEELATFESGTAIVVDNASPNADAGRLEAFLEDFPHKSVRLIRSDRNGGFAAGNNLAFAAARALDRRPDFVMLLNPDAKVRPGAIRELVRVMRERPRAAVVGARLENPDGSSRGGAFVFPSLMGEFARGSGLGPLLRLWPVNARVGAEPTRVDWVTGAAMLIRMDALDALGGLDEDYFLYFEEVDFMLRAARAGWEVWHAPAARVVHIPGSATGVVAGKANRGRMPRYWFESWLRYFSKNHGRVYARAAALARLAGEAVGAPVKALRGGGTPFAWVADFARFCLIGSTGPAARRGGAE